MLRAQLRCQTAGKREPTRQRQAATIATTRGTHLCHEDERLKDVVVDDGGNRARRLGMRHLHPRGRWRWCAGGGMLPRHPTRSLLAGAAQPNHPPHLLVPSHANKLALMSKVQPSFCWLRAMSATQGAPAFSGGVSSLHASSGCATSSSPDTPSAGMGGPKSAGSEGNSRLKLPVCTLKEGRGSEGC